MILKNQSQKLSDYYADCSQLPLRIFCDIVNSDNTGLLKRNPSITTTFTNELWGDIIMEYGKLDGNNKLTDTFDKQNQLLKLKNSYTAIKAMIRLLFVITPDTKGYQVEAIQTIQDLKQMGYVVDTSNSESYKKSLLRCDKKANSLVTYIQLKANELRSDQEPDEKGIDFDDLISLIQSHFNVNDDISVKRYIKMKQIIVKKNSKK